MRLGSIMVSVVAAFAGAGASAGDSVELISAEKPNGGWSFGNGPEFPGAKGRLSVDPDVPRNRQPALRLEGDFTGGGNYVQTGIELPKEEMDAISFWVMAPDATQLTVRLIDGSGQCHQLRLNLRPAKGWQKMDLPVEEIFRNMGTPQALDIVAKYEKWGGANDSKWHNPGKAMYVLMGRGMFGESKTGAIWISEAVLRKKTKGKAAPAAYRETFEEGAPLPAGWEGQGQAAVAAGGAFKGEKCLKLARSLEQLQVETRAQGAAFQAAPGAWELSGACKADLESPDNSYCGSVTVEALGAGGAVLERIAVHTQHGKGPWRSFSKQAELPQGTANARFAVQVQKAHGAFCVDELAAAPASGAQAGPKRVGRILLSAGRIGNLLLPDDKPVLRVTVEALTPLPDAERQLACVVRDYWGAEQAAPATASLEQKGQDKNKTVYAADLDLSAAGMELGRYYEAHVAIPRERGEPYREYCGIARLPEAVTRQHKPEDIPFTIRNWDSRIREYFFLADRIGIRQIGVWGGWSEKPPYAPHLPGLETCRELGAKWITGTPAASIENEGFKRYDEKALREGMRNFLQAYADKGMQAICLGNEPHGNDEKVKENVRAYRAIYEAVKAFDPKIEVIATSVPPEERYFKEGFQNYCDSYDFHVYETYQDVANAIKAYRTMMVKYNAEKPIHCTELGLNSQGMARLPVASELIKKVAVFFAAGGKTVSWFTMQYPDPAGKARGTSGDAHCVFDCQYSQYSPRLDAIAYYDIVNGICNKRFVEEKQYEDGVRAYLFRDKDGLCLQVLWKEGERRDAFVPLAGVEKAELIRIDGSRASLDAREGGVSLGILPEPLLLLYDRKEGGLADRLGEPKLAVGPAPKPVLKGGSQVLAVTGKGLQAESLRAVAPPFWKAELRQAGADSVECVVTAPEKTSAREGRIMVQRVAGGALTGEAAVNVKVAGPIAVSILPLPGPGGSVGTIELRIRNNGKEPKSVRWDLSLTEELPMQKGVYALNAGRPPSAYLKGESEGQVRLDGGEEKRFALPLADADPLTLYRVRGTVRDPLGGNIECERLVGGFAAARRAKAPPAIDGALDEADWKAASACAIADAKQFFLFGEGKGKGWTGPADLSGEVRFLWDEQCLYVGVTVKDDVFRSVKCDGEIWNQDGLQFLMDPSRGSSEKPGKYDYSMAVGTKGPQAWCHLSAHASVPAGESKAIRLAAKRADETTGNVTYEVAIPWTQLAPFRPEPGADLGLAVILNEDDGPGREGFMGWFGGVHSKDLDMVGDVILVE